MTTEEFDWEQALNDIREIRECSDYWSVRFYSTYSDADIALPCTMISNMLGWIEDNITDEYEKQKRKCDSIKSPYEQENP